MILRSPHSLLPRPGGTNVSPLSLQILTSKGYSPLYLSKVTRITEGRIDEWKAKNELLSYSSWQIVWHHVRNQLFQELCHHMEFSCSFASMYLLLNWTSTGSMWLNCDTIWMPKAASSCYSKLSRLWSINCLDIKSSFYCMELASRCFLIYREWRCRYLMFKTSRINSSPLLQSQWDMRFVLLTNADW